MKRLLNDLVGDMWAVEVARINVIDSLRDGLSQNRDGCVDIARGAPHLRARELHGSVAYALNGHRGSGKVKSTAKVLLICHVKSLLNERGVSTAGMYG
jgi:hypothetical protein